jgi:hypothetical protein
MSGSLIFKLRVRVTEFVANLSRRHFLWKLLHDGKHECADGLKRMSALRLCRV